MSIRGETTIECPGCHRELVIQLVPATDWSPPAPRCPVCGSEFKNPRALLGPVPTPGTMVVLIEPPA